MIRFEIITRSALFLFIYIATVSNHPQSNLAEDSEVDESPIYRLPDYVIPTFYALKIKPDLEDSCFEGTVDISIQVKRTTNNIKLFNKGLRVTECKIEANEKSVDCTYKLDQRYDLLIITSPVQLRKRIKHSIFLRYSGKLNETMTGFYKSSYREDGVKKWLMITNFEPTHARQAFPCFDEPRFKTSFSISIARKKNQRAISNMPIEKTIDDEECENTQWDIFYKTKPIPTYLVGFMVSTMTNVKHSETISLWARKDIIPYTKYAVNQGHKLFKSLEEFTDLPYFLSKVDIVVLPHLKKEAIHAWGMIVFKERNIIIDEDGSSLSQKIVLTRTVSHELSYLWFGSLLTPVKWDYLWLRDGFAKYFEYFGTALVEPEWNLEELFVLEVLQPALWKEASHGRSLTTSVTLLSHFKNIYDVTSHEKAASILRMLENIMTPKSFRKAVKNFLAQSMGKSTIDQSQSQSDAGFTPDHFFKTLEHQVKADSIAIPPQTTITKILKSWTENTGYPLINLHLMIPKDDKNVKIYFSQKPFTTKDPSPSAPIQNWIVPITCATNSYFDNGTVPGVIWLYNTKLESPVLNTTEWILCDLQPSAYYRVRYDKENALHFTRTLRENPESFPPLIMAQMIDNAFAVSANLEGETSLTAFRLAYLLQNDINPIPWISASFHFNRLWTQYRDAMYNSQLYYFIRYTIANEMLNHVGFNVKETDNALTRKARTAILSLLIVIGSSSSIESAINEYQKNIADLSKVQPDLKDVVYCAALRFSKNYHLVWDDLWSLYKRTEMPYDKRSILMAFACTNNETLIRRAITRLTDEIQEEDREYFINALTYSYESVKAALEYLRDNIIAFQEYDRDVNPLWKSILTSLEPRIQTVTHYKILEEMDIYLRSTRKPDYVNFHKFIITARQKALQRIRDNYENAYWLRYDIGDAIGLPLKYSPRPGIDSWRSSGAASTPIYLTYVFFCGLVLYHNKT